MNRLLFDETTLNAIPLDNAALPPGWGTWDLPEGWTYEAGGGPEGCPALRLVRSDATAYLNARLAMKLTPGRRYKMRGASCVAASSGTGVSAHTGVEFFDDENRFLGGAYIPPAVTAEVWTHGEAEFTVPQYTHECRLMFYIGAGVAGEARFAVPQIGPAPFRWTAYPLTPVRDELPAAGGEICCAYFSQGALKPGVALSAAGATLRYRLEQTDGERCLAQGTARVDPDRFTLSLPNLPSGPATLRFSLLDEAGSALGEKALPVMLVTAATVVERAARGCVIDKRGRAFVKNRPYFPIGLYMGLVEIAELEEISQSAFNCLMPYGSPVLKLSGSKKEGVAAAREVMDACEAYGMKVIFGLSGAYDGPGAYVCQGLGAKGGEAVSRAAALAFRDHPALLAWYINDEQPIENLPNLMERRRMMRELDPLHPIFAVMCQVPEFPLYGELVDVYGIDPYPIVHPTSNHIRIAEYAHDMAEVAMRTNEGMALWTAIQAHNIGAYDPRARKDEPFYRAEYRDPTFEEMLAMSLLSVIRGARGFLFFSYPDHSRPAFDVHKRAARWHNTKRVAQALRDLEEAVMSDVDAPQPRMTVTQGKIEVRAFRDAAGRDSVVLVGIGPGPCCAEVELSGAAAYTSRFQRCTPLGEGRYRFAGQDACADVLTSSSSTP